MYYPCHRLCHSSIYRSKINWADKRAGQLDDPHCRSMSFKHLSQISTENCTQVVNIFVAAAFIDGLEHGLGKHQVEMFVPASKALLTFAQARVDAEDPHPPNDTMITLKVCNDSAFWTSF